MRRITYQEFHQDRDKLNLRLIDVREVNEFEDVHVHGAELFPLSSLQKGELPEKDSRTIALICRSGGRSAMACKILEDSGFEECINVEGGTLAAIEEGEEHVERPSN